MLAGAMNTAERLGGLFRLKTRSIGNHHLGQPDDGVQRRAQFVAHIGQETRLGAIGRVGLFHGSFELGLALLELGDVGVGRDRAAIVGFALVDLDPAPVGAVLHMRALGVATPG